MKKYGLCKSFVPAWRFLYYLPLIILASGNLWNGVAVNYTPMDTACRIVCMLCVGFLEEVIFRGLLFTAIAKDNIKSAIVISSVTFGRYGTGGWASPDGTINCIEQAYDFESERLLVSLLKHEAQHTVDMKQFPNITQTELEYRAKLVELHYANDLDLLQKFLSQADENRESDSHAVASARIKREFANTDQRLLPCIQTRAMELFHAHTKELEGKYGKPNAVQREMLIENIDRLHTTPMGVDRIKRNLKLDTDDVVGYCKTFIQNLCR